MKDLVQLSIVIVFLVLVVMIGTPMVGREIEGLLSEVITDKAELEVAKGERALMEASAQGQLEIMRASAKAVRADTQMVSMLVGLIVVMLMIQSGGTLALIYVMLNQRK